MEVFISRGLLFYLKSKSICSRAML